MITYNRSAFGLNLIFRVHGSAVYRSIFPSLFSVGLYFLVHFRSQAGLSYQEQQDLGHPYAIGVLVSSITFLIVFRASQGYARYWEGASCIHQMMGKWMDATIHSCVYHLQCDHYKDIKPPSYFDYPELNHLFLTRDRERGADYYDQVEEETEHPLDDDLPVSARSRSYLQDFRDGQGKERRDPRPGRLPDGRRMARRLSSPFSANFEANKIERKMQKNKQREQLERAKVKSINSLNVPADSRSSIRSRSPLLGDIGEAAAMFNESMSSNTDGKFFEEFLDDSEREYGDKPTPLVGRPRLDGNWSHLYRENRQVFVPENNNLKGFASVDGGRTPPLFLQELAHLSSLLVAVSLSTLRNDMEGFESPLSCFQPGQPWPEVDPDRDEILKHPGKGHRLKALFTFLGMGRSPKEQTRYNASRPLPVIGGVSDAEIRFLQMARGPYAKTQLCWNWLSEFMIREHLAGSMGAVGPPIISRCIQFLGDGMIYYNHARKIMFIPFPFPHAQLSVMFILVLVPCIPFLMEQYVDEVWLASTLTFLTVMCLSAIHEVARELENPFRNVPNELPLVTLQAHYNETLITMYSGWHPDQFWDGDRILRRHKRRGGGARGTTQSRGSKHDAEIADLKSQLAEQAKLIDKISQNLDQQKGRSSMMRENSFHPRYSESVARVSTGPLVVSESARKIRNGANESVSSSSLSIDEIEDVPLASEGPLSVGMSGDGPLRVDMSGDAHSQSSEEENKDLAGNPHLLEEIAMT
ncbi:unnamed protein product [Cylindrotheca closterium]|uniref:Uncharacterized protein n=1 Tax=Cylindrotheca closterium TaxID=2856 RepID=A0AAD2JKW5_9STRA|nr:unnamed protein product [Cylindrotheca closterium]